jgi:hypothetical protein
MHGTFADFGSSPPSIASDPPSLPLVFEQAPEGGGRFVLIAVLFPLLVALMVPFWLVVVQLASDPAARAILAARPLVGVQLAAGLLGVASIFGWPLAMLARRALGRRRVTIGNGSVRSEVVGRFGKRSWIEPLAGYAGLTHRVRTSLSGVRHELVLVHPRPSRSVILQSGPQIPPEAAAAAARLFTLAEIPSREAASFTPLHGYFGLAEPKPQLAPG